MAISAGTVAAALTLDTKEFNSALQQSRSLVETFGASNLTVTEKLGVIGKSMKSVGTIATVGLTMPLVAAGTQATRTFMSFDDSMRQVIATMNAGEADAQKLTDAAKQYGAETRYSASESAEALNYLALAGYDADEAIGALPTVLRLAQAGGLDLAYASDLVTDSMSALGLEMGDLEGFSDQLAVTAQKSNTSISQLGQGILTVGGLAKNLKGGTVELNAELGILADNGIKGAEGGTHLRNVLLSLMNPTEEGAALLAQYTRGIYDAEGHLRSLDDILGELGTSLNGLTDAERNSAINTIFNKTDIAAVNALLSGTGARFQELTGYIRDSEGAAEQMAATMEGGIGGAARNLKSAAEAVAIEVGEVLAPHVQSAAEWVTGLARGFAGMNDGMKQTIVGVAGVAAATGPALIVLGKLAGLVSSIAAGTSILAGPLGWATLGTAAVVSGVIALNSALDQTETSFDRARRSLRTASDEYYETAREAFEKGRLQVTQDVDVDVKVNSEYAAEASTLYSDIYTWLTDGMPDTEEQAAEVNRRVNEYYGKLLAEIDLSENEELAKLKEQFELGYITYDEFIEKSAQVKADAQSARDELDALQESTLQFIEDYAGAPTKVVSEAYDEIDALEKRTEELVAKITNADAQLSLRETSAERAVAAGATDVETVNEALGNAYGRYEQQREATKEEYGAKKQRNDELRDQLLASMGEDAAREAGVIQHHDRRANWDERQEAAEAAEDWRKYASEVQQIFNDLAKSFPEQAETLREGARKLSLKDEAARLVNEEKVTYSQLSSDMQAWFEEHNFNQEWLESLTPDRQQFAIREALQGVLAETMQVSADSVLQEIEGTEFGELISSFLEQEAERGMEGLDLTSAEEILRLALGEMVQEGTSGAGGEFEAAGTTSASLFTAAAAETIAQGAGSVSSATSGLAASAAAAARSGGLNSGTGSSMAGNLVTGIVSGLHSGLGRVREAARSLAAAAIAAARANLGINSPSKVFEEIGRFVGEGMALGIDDSAFDAQEAMRRLTNTDGLAGKRARDRGEAALAGGPTYNITFNDAKIRDRDEARNLLRETLRLRQQDQRARGV